MEINHSFGIAKEENTLERGVFCLTRFTIHFYKSVLWP